MPMPIPISISSNPETAAVEPTRYHALDRVRALAMLMGVVYHTMLFRMFTGGGPPRFASMGQIIPSKVLSDWMHSFRMPMFFLIAGFFGRMMLVKYGLWEFLKKRWWRIGIPLVVGMFTFGPAYVLTRDLISSPPGFGPGGPRMGPHGGFINGMPRPGAGGFPPGGTSPFGAGGGLADRLFGPYTRFVQLNHLWFLWYLLVFVTLTPLLTRLLGVVARPGSKFDGDRVGRWVFRWGLAPAVLAVVAWPFLMLTRSPFGWFLGLAPAIFRAFPDFLIHLDPDMAFYYAHFLMGWWLHRERAALPSLAKAWLINLVVGLAGFGVAIALEQNSGSSSPRFSSGTTRLVAYASYCLGSACTSFAFLGVFLRYLDFPSKTWRYLADTALWVYLIHQPLVLLGLAAARPLGLAWWSLTVLVSSASVLAALGLYEMLVRRTPLVRWFGPSNSRRLAASARMVEDEDDGGQVVSTASATG